MRVDITTEQAQRLVALHNDVQAAQVRLSEAVQTLAPGIESVTMKDDEGQFYLTDEIEVEENAVQE
jgi:hypothetical protein